MAWGHPLDAVWHYTPRQATAWAALGGARKRSEMAERLMIAALGAQGKRETINETLKEWDE